MSCRMSPAYAVSISPSCAAITITAAWCSPRTRKGQPYAIGRGGRYDEVGKAFGRARPATGFSMDLRELAALSANGGTRSRVLAPYAPNDGALQRRIAALRARGTPVVVELPGHASTRSELGCDRRLVRRDGKWVVEKL